MNMIDSLKNNRKQVGIASGGYGDLLLLINLHYSYPKNIEIEKMLLNKIEYYTTGEIEITESAKGLFTGVLGLGYCLSLIERYLPKINDIIKVKHKKIYNDILRPILLEYFEKFCESKHIDYRLDLLFGISGALCYFSSAMNINKDAYLMEKFKNFVIELESIDIIDYFAITPNYTSNFYPRNKEICKTSFNILGMAHGVISFAIFLRRAIDKYNPEFLNIANKVDERIIKEIKQYWKQNTNRYILPEIFSTQKRKSWNNFEHLTISWCYGLSGVYLYLKNYFYNREDSEFLNQIEDVIQSKILKKEVYSDINLCHGLAMPYYLNRFFFRKQTKQEEVNKLLENRIQQVMHNTKKKMDYEILNGTGGVFLVLESCKRNTRFLGDEIFGVPAEG